ncbi:hypothetical protein BH11PSE11_BH11PSE11_14110 [soil metagenome]
MFHSKTITVIALDGGFSELCFRRQGAFSSGRDRNAIADFLNATKYIASKPDIRGVLVTGLSAAEAPECEAINAGPRTLSYHEMADDMFCADAIRAFADLPVPTIAAINGFAFGAALETALSASMRVLTNSSRVCLPDESGSRSADAALEAGLVDVVSAPEALREAALVMLRMAAEGDIDWQGQRDKQRHPSPFELQTDFVPKHVAELSGELI